MVTSSVIALVVGGIIRASVVSSGVVVSVVVVGKPINMHAKSFVLKDYILLVKKLLIVISALSTL